MQIVWQLKNFDALTAKELYDILQLRSEVFVVEQNCVYLDMDGKDEGSFHFCGYHQNKLIAYTRLLPPGLSYTEASIGRVVTSPSVRRSGAGRLLMQQSIKTVHDLFGTVPIKIGAQLYLKAFYESFGFILKGEVYLEDGIEHIAMLKSVSS
jgi:ElaA protein